MPAAENVEMKVADSLAAVGAAIVDDAEPILQPFLGGQFLDHKVEMPDDLRLGWLDVHDRGDMYLGDDQEVYRGLRVNVAKCDKPAILVYYVAGDLSGSNLAEDAISQCYTPFLYQDYSVFHHKLFEPGGPNSSFKTATRPTPEGRTGYSWNGYARA